APPPPPPGSGGAAPAPAPPPRVVLGQSASIDTRALPATPEGGLVSEELLHRSIRSNVALAEALGRVVQQMSLGLGAILSHAELLLVYREDAKEKRAGAINSIQQEALRLRRMLADLGASAGPAPSNPAVGGPPPTPPAASLRPGSGAPAAASSRPP